MFKSWRSQKKKFEAVFKLQFQATQVPHLKKPALIISLVPENVGKPTFKLEKAAVQDGTCSWENPIYVAVKLVKELKTEKLQEKIYHFIVSSGSSKSGYLGEASIDFSDFTEETEPLTVSLPLKFANSGAILHVTIQKVQGGADQRHIEDNEDLTLPRDGSLKNQLSNGHSDGNDKSCAEETDLDIFSLQNAEQDSNTKASISSDASSHSIFRQNSMPLNGVDTITKKNRLHQRSSTDWSLGSGSDGSIVESTNSPDDSLPRELQEDPNESIQKLKSEMSSLMRQSELSEMELQSLRKQIVKESRRAQDLSRQIVELTEERKVLKTECVQLKSSQKSVDEALNQFRTQNEDLKIQLEEVRWELSHEKEFNANLQVRLEKEQDSNSKLILAVRDLDEMLEKRNLEISSLSSKLELGTNVEGLQEKWCQCNAKENENQQALPEWEDLAQVNDDGNNLHLLKQKIADLSDEIEIYRQDREKVERYIEQLTQDYEELKQENHNMSSKLEENQVQQLKAQNESTESLAAIEELESQVLRLEEKMKKQTQEFSESLLSINELEAQVKGLEKELEKQAQNFENDLDVVTNAKIEQEQRAIRAEEVLRKTRWKNAITAERLQGEFQKLSMEMAARYEENEKQTTNALRECNKLHEQKRILEERLQTTAEQLALVKEQNRAKVEELSTQLDLKTKDMERMSLELECKSKQLNSMQKHGEEKQETSSTEIQTLKAEIEALIKEKNDVSKQKEDKLRDETAQIATSLEDTKMQKETWRIERIELEEKLAMAKQKEQTAQEELLISRSLKEEKERMVKNLLSEIESLRAQYIELKHSLSREESEKEILHKQVFELKGELRKKEEACASIDKKLKIQNGKALFLREENIPQYEMSNSDDKKVGIATFERNDKTCTQQELKVITSKSKDESNLTQLLTQLELLQGRNKSMETELKEMQERYSEISLKFAEVEGERQQLVMTVRNLKNNPKRN